MPDLDPAQDPQFQLADPQQAAPAPEDPNSPAARVRMLDAHLGMLEKQLSGAAKPTEQIQQADLFTAQALKEMQQAGQPKRGLLQDLAGPLIIGLLSSLGQPRRRYDPGLPLRAGIGAGVNYYIQRQAREEQEGLHAKDRAQIYSNLAAASRKSAMAQTKDERDQINADMRITQSRLADAKAEQQFAIWMAMEKNREKQLKLMQEREARMAKSEADRFTIMQGNAKRLEKIETDRANKAGKGAEVPKEFLIGTRVLVDKQTGNVVNIRPTNAQLGDPDFRSKYVPLDKLNEYNFIGRIAATEKDFDIAERGMVAVLGKFEGEQTMTKALQDEFRSRIGSTPALAAAFATVPALVGEVATAMGGSTRVTKFMSDLVKKTLPQNYVISARAALMELELARRFLRARRTSILEQPTAEQVEMLTDEEIDTLYKQRKVEGEHFFGRQAELPKPGERRREQRVEGDE